MQSLLRHTGGQPFLLLEKVKSLRLSGQRLVERPGDDPLPLPPAVDTLIGHRLASLPATAQALLQLLAVAGGSLRLTLAAQAMAQPLPALATAWSQLAAAQLVQPSGEIAHDLLRECVLRTLPASARQAWHPALAASPAGRLAEWASLLMRAAAAHQQAGATEAELDDCIDALTARSLRLGPAAVAPELAQLLDASHHGPPRARLMMLQGTLAFNQLRFTEVMRLAEAALTQAGAGTRTLQQARLLYGRAAAMAGQPAQALQSLHEACASAKAPGLPEPQLEALAGFDAMAISDALSAVMSLSMRARAWAHQGRLAQALQSMAPLATPGTAGMAGAMARTGLAQLQLWLGWPRKALATLDGDDSSWPTGARSGAM